MKLEEMNPFQLGVFIFILFALGIASLLLLFYYIPLKWLLAILGIVTLYGMSTGLAASLLETMDGRDLLRRIGPWMRIGKKS